MKKIFKYILISSALFSFAFSSWAQETAPDAQVVGPYKHAGGVATGKQVTGPNEDGTYTITLETFAEGKTTITQSSVPADIVLVLDVSSSMDQSPYTYKGRRGQRWEALRWAVEDFVHTIYDNAAEAREKDPNYAGNRIAIVTYCRNARLITGGWMDIESVVTKTGNNYSGQLIDIINTNNTNGVWASNARNTKTNGTRPDHGLDLTIDKLLSGNDDSSSARDGANLTVVLFTDGYPTDNNATNMGEPQNNGSSSKFEPPIANKTLYYASIIKQTYGAKFYSIGLISSVDQANDWSWRNYRRVNTLMDWISSNYPNAAWNDGVVDENNLYIENPGSNGNHYDGYDSQTTNMSFVWKQNATGGNPAIPAPWQNSWGANDGMNPTIAVNGFSAGTQSEDKDSEGNTIDYSTIVDDNTSFESVFKAIASAAGGSAQPIGTETQVRDVLTSSFTIPDNVTEASQINLRYYTLDINPDGLAWGTTQSVPDGITWEVKKDETGHNSLEVHGFEYSKQDTQESLDANAADGNWVGGRYNDDTKQWYYAGRKLVIKFDIHPNGEATGGNGTSTNTGDSGVWIKNADGTYTNINSYDVPHADLPVNIKIKKIGLRHGESATFEIWRIRPLTDENGKIVYNAIGKPEPAEATEPGEDEMYGWSNWTKVILTNKGDDGDAVVKTLKALDPNWVYRVVEDDWGWAYTVEGTGEVQTTSTVEVNPFEFTNTEKTGVPKHAEAVTINHFKGTHSEARVEEYQSSKVKSF